MNTDNPETACHDWEKAIAPPPYRLQPWFTLPPLPAASLTLLPSPAKPRPPSDQNPQPLQRSPSQ
ncbi:MAG: hypothetical protein AAGG51_07715 [Cyanobacteria bacterium P01_G01_bin.54]